MNPEISRNSHHHRQNFSALEIGLKSEFFIIVKTTAMLQLILVMNQIFTVLFHPPAQKSLIGAKMGR